MWRLETLRDFSAVAGWLESRRRMGKHDAALRRYARTAGPILRRSLCRYGGILHALDQRTGGLLARSPAGRNNTSSILEHSHQATNALAGQLDLLAGRKKQALAAWRELLESPAAYRRLLQGLIGEVGQFETILPVLPGLGEAITDPTMQRLLEEMYLINTRSLRICELIRDVWISWQEDPAQPCTSFLDCGYDFAKGVHRMLLEYMVQADPVRIQARRKRTGQAGHHYRFWKAAENVRQMADVSYETHRRRPVPHRRYIETRLDSAPLLCVDARRLGWALKEVINNALTACSIMTADEQGRWVAEPLDRHAVPDPRAAIRVDLHPATVRKRWRRHSILRLTVLDEGVGIAPEHLPHVCLWGFSPRREEVRRRMQHASANPSARREVQIGGKGIGLGYASSVFAEHGGCLNVYSTNHEGTEVVMELPVPTPLKPVG